MSNHLLVDQTQIDTRISYLDSAPNGVHTPKQGASSATTGCEDSSVAKYSKETCHIKHLLMGLMLLTVDVE